MIHELHINDDMFLPIKTGTKTVELRLNDEKRKLLNVGDFIRFTNRTTNEQIMVEIIGLKKYNNFSELYKDYDKVSIGYKKYEEAIPSDMEKYYSKEEQEKYGVLAIEMKVINS